MESQKETELVVRKIVSEEIGEHRQFLQTQFKHMTWGIGIIFIAAATVFTFILGKSINESKEKIVQEVDVKVIEYRINENLKQKASEFVTIAVDRAVNNEETIKKIEQLVGQKTEEYVKSVSDNIQNQITELVKSEVININQIDAKAIIEKSLTEKVQELKNQLLKLYTTSKILAAIRVESNNIVSKSEGVNYSPSTGIVSFSNPKRLNFIPVISDISNISYMTEKVFIREINAPSQFRVWRTTLDTGNRNYPPDSFTAIVIGFE